MDPIDFKDDVFQSINNEFTRCNAVMKFMPKTWEQNEKMRTLYEGVRETRNKIQLAWQNVVKELSILDSTLAQHSGPIEIKITDEPYWYRAGDVFSQSFNLHC